jgi:hypothetical protein
MLQLIFFGGRFGMKLSFDKEKAKKKRFRHFLEDKMYYFVNICYSGKSNIRI